MFIGLKKTLQVYDLLCEQYKKEDLWDQLETNIARDSVVYIEDDGNVIGAAIAWHIEDPYDVTVTKKWPGQSPNGKYVHFPMIYVKKDRRDGKVLKSLIKKCLMKNESATRISFVREDRTRKLRVLEMDKNG